MEDTTYIVTLVARAKAGSKEALGELYDAFISRIYRFVYFRVGKREDAEDVTEQVFLKVYGHIGEYEERGLPLEAWIFRIARNQITDFYRTRRDTEVPLEEAVEVADSHPTPEEETERVLEYEQVLRAIKKLPEQYQEIIILKFIEERDTNEISILLEKPESHVRVLQSRALAKLREVLGI
ncbi:sigma-70 family RNA polymerase sigma factor [Candidatus Gottesmanbacteria bacterium]|nr:sigma-70 family RNA polymerase sigma factor [Candidatus Gottesmanbacteria bacterium]